VVSEWGVCGRILTAIRSNVRAVIEPQPYEIRVPDQVLDELRGRLLNSRWPEPLPGRGPWGYGADLDYLRELTRYWTDTFDWRAQERLLNSFPQFTAEIQGATIHFVHQRGRGPDPFPLVLTHGWPSSFVELLKVIPLLTDPAAHGGDEHDAFDVVVPSLPGYGFSGRLATAGSFTNRTVAGLWARLMTEALGYARFGAQGTDIGAGITYLLGAEHKDTVAGIHVPGVIAPPPTDRPLTEPEKEFQARQGRFYREGGGYAIQQATYPMTLAIGLNDSPAGLAAWIVDKWRAWSDCDGDLERRFSKDELLTNITVYWVTGTIADSFRPYFDRQHDPEARPWGRIEVPVGVAAFPKDLPGVPREWAESAYNIARWTEMPRGGHFPAAEEPELLAEDLRELFRPLR
jgi:pimeloyl-ACP methyl ester carboxylesterase